MVLHNPMGLKFFNWLAFLNLWISHNKVSLMGEGMVCELKDFMAKPKN